MGLGVCVPQGRGDGHSRARCHAGRSGEAWRAHVAQRGGHQRSTIANTTGAMSQSPPHTAIHQTMSEYLKFTLYWFSISCISGRSTAVTEPERGFSEGPSERWDSFSLRRLREERARPHLSAGCSSRRSLSVTNLPSRCRTRSTLYVTSGHPRPAPRTDTLLFVL